MNWEKILLINPSSHCHHMYLSGCSPGGKREVSQSPRTSVLDHGWKNFLPFKDLFLMSPLTFLPLCGPLAHAEVWDAHRVALWCVCFLHHSAPAGVCVSCRSPGSILGWELSLWATWERLAGMAKGSWGRRDGDGHPCSLLANYSVYFSYYSLIPSVYPILQEGIFHFGEAMAGMKVWVFWGLVLVSPFPHHGSGITGFNQCVLFQRGFGFLPSAPCETLTSSKTVFERLRCTLEGWFGLFKPRGLCGFPCRAVRILVTTMVWTWLVWPKGSLAGWAVGSQPGFEMSFWINLIVEAKISALPFRKIWKSCVLLGALKDPAPNWRWK